MNSKRPFYENLLLCLGRAISTRRKRLQLSQEELAARTGVDRAFISNVERGKRNPSFGVVAAIARGLKIRMSRLTGLCEECVTRIETEEQSSRQINNGNAPPQSQ